MQAAVITARTMDDGVTHTVTDNRPIYPFVACRALLTWNKSSIFRQAERCKGRDVDCMACIAAFS